MLFHFQHSLMAYSRPFKWQQINLKKYCIRSRDEDEGGRLTAYWHILDPHFLCVNVFIFVTFWL